MPDTQYVAYYRVSTQKQGQSGLGLEGQQRAVNAFCRPVASFTEIETGTSKRERPELQRAIAACKRLGAVLVIAKLDRLARNVHFVSGLMESGVEFVACDSPHANRLTVHILAAVAEDEARRISERTKAALASYKARGGRLGNPKNLTTTACQERQCGERSGRPEAPGRDLARRPGVTCRRPNFDRGCRDVNRQRVAHSAWQSMVADVGRSAAQVTS